MKPAPLLAAAFVAVSASLPMAGTASAAPVAKNAISAPAGDFLNVRWRGGWRHHGYYGHRGWRNGYYHRGPGFGPALGGLAAGAIIGGAIANSNAQAANSDAYCSRRFRSYDPASGTYLGYDGNRHPCP